MSDPRDPLPAPEEESPPASATNALRYAQALDQGLNASNSAGVSAALDLAPAAAQAELHALLHLAQAVQSAGASTAPSATFRAEARSRLLAGIATATEPAQPITLVTSRPRLLTRRALPWLTRAAVALVALGVAGSTTLNASASALPGEPLYSVKQAREALALRMAPNDEARAEALLRQADARLLEATTLLQRGRMADAAAVAARYDTVVDQLSSQISTDVARDARSTTPGPDDDALLAQLAEHQARLQAALSVAAPSAPAVEQALEVSGRGLERAAEVLESREAPPSTEPTLAPPVVTPFPTPPAASDSYQVELLVAPVPVEVREAESEPAEQSGEPDQELETEESRPISTNQEPRSVQPPPPAAARTPEREDDHQSAPARVADHQEDQDGRGDDNRPEPEELAVPPLLPTTIDAVAAWRVEVADTSRHSDEEDVRPSDESLTREARTDDSDEEDALKSESQERPPSSASSKEVSDDREKRDDDGRSRDSAAAPLATATSTPRPRATATSTPKPASMAAPTATRTPERSERDEDSRRVSSREKERDGDTSSSEGNRRETPDAEKPSSETEKD